MLGIRFLSRTRYIAFPSIIMRNASATGIQEFAAPDNFTTLDVNNFLRTSDVSLNDWPWLMRKNVVNKSLVCHRIQSVTEQPRTAGVRERSTHVLIAIGIKPIPSVKGIVAPRIKCYHIYLVAHTLHQFILSSSPLLCPEIAVRIWSFLIF